LTEIKKHGCDYCREESADPRGWLELRAFDVAQVNDGDLIVTREEGVKVQFCGPACLLRWVWRELMQGRSHVPKAGVDRAAHTGTLSEAQLLAACGKVTAGQHEN
jgi:hypothetical protein